MRPSDLGITVPNDRFRPYQEAAIDAIVSSAKKVTLLEAPTGAGKSLIALAAAKIKKARRAAVVVHTKQLQLQYAQTIITPPLAVVTGRSNHPCLIQAGTAEDAPCSVSGPGDCPRHHDCGYYAQIRHALSRPVSVHNYAMWLNLANGVGWFGNDPRLGPLDFLVLDEAHLLENQLAAFCTVELHAQTLARAQLTLPDWGTDWSKWQDWAASIVAHLTPVVDEDHDFADVDPERARYVGACKTVHERCGRLITMSEDDIVERDQFKTRLVYRFKRVWVADEARTHVLSHGRKILLMSATFLGAEHVCRGLGIPEDDVDYFALPSTFPKENRPVVFRPSVKVHHRMTADDEKLMVASLDAVLDAHPAGKTLVHTGNYRVAEACMTHSRHRARMRTHTTGDRGDVLALFKKSTAPLVLVSPSMTTGVDLPGDECALIVVLKLPFPNKGDEVVARRMKEGPDGLPNPRGQAWYEWVTACTLVQGFGRGMRSADDRCTVVVLDENIRWFRHRIRDLLPAWVTEAVVVEHTPDGEQVVRDVRRDLAARFAL